TVQKLVRVRIAGQPCRSWMGLQLTSRRYAVFGTVESNEAPVDHADRTDVGNPARDCAVCQDASRLGDAVLDSAMLRGALTAVRIRRARGGGLRRFARSRPLDCIRLRRTRGRVRRRVLWASRRPPAVASWQVEFVAAVCVVGS